MQNDVGFIIIPSVFGDTVSTKQKIEKLNELGCPSSFVDIYKNHPIHKEERGTSRPNILKIILHKDSKRLKKSDELAFSFDEKTLFRNIDELVKSKRYKNAQSIILAGFGFGATICLRYMENRIRSKIKMLNIWYPHIVLPNKSIKTRTSKSIRTPSFYNIPKTTKIIIFHGDKDSIVEPGNLEKAKEYASTLPNVELVVYKGAKHGFAEKFIQGWIPNLPYYWFCPANRRAHRLSWQRVFQELEQIAK